VTADVCRLGRQAATRHYGYSAIRPYDLTGRLPDGYAAIRLFARTAFRKKEFVTGETRLAC